MNPFSLNNIVSLALLEDLGPGDISAKLTVPYECQGRAVIKAREAIRLSGLRPACETLRQVDESASFTALAEDGQTLQAGAEIAILEGRAQSLLAAERVLLNFIMRLSGVATLTAAYLMAANNPRVKIVDTRKTTPGLRLLEKEAVLHGGGFNHRFALYDGILIKDNHIAAAGSIKKALASAKSKAAHGLKIEVEVDDLFQLKEALEAGADIIMLDNMGPEKLREAVKITEDFFYPALRQVLLEASGGVKLNTVAAIAQSGVDLISVGALTHSATSVDVGLDWL